MLPRPVPASAARVVRALDAAIAHLRRLDRRARIDPVRLASCATILPTTALAAFVAAAIGGGCGPRTTPAASPVGAQVAPAPGETAGQPTTALPPPTGKGRPVRITLYHIAVEPCPDPPQVSLPRCGGGSIARVSNSFRHAAALQGSAKLCDGRVIGVRTVSPLCFAVVGDGFPWGVTASGRPATPFRSIAVDTKLFPLGRWYYVPELDGLALPAPAEGKTHDGCVHTDDVGGAVKGDQIDFFVGTRSAVDHLKARFSEATIHLVEADDRCSAKTSF